MQGVEIYKFIKPHLGSINSTGDHGLDMERLENFKTYEELIYCLLEDLDQSVESSKNGYGASEKMINNRARSILVELHKWLMDFDITF